MHPYDHFSRGQAVVITSQPWASSITTDLVGARATVVDGMIPKFGVVKVQLTSQDLLPNDRRGLLYIHGSRLRACEADDNEPLRR